MDYIIFGIVDNGVMILGAFTGIEVEKYLPERFKMGALMPIVGAGLGNATSDFLGGLVIPLFNRKFKLSMGVA